MTAHDFCVTRGAKAVIEAPRPVRHPFAEIVMDMSHHPDAISIGADPYVMIRPEGQWHKLGILERSASRPVSRPSINGVRH